MAGTLGRMPETDCLAILLQHDRWATSRLMDACETLDDARFHQPFEMGLRTLHDTLLHMTGAIRVWTDTLAVREPRPWSWTPTHRHTLADIRQLFESSHSELSAEATRRPLDEVVTRRFRDGREFHFSRAVIVTHITTHGMHHRAQCLNMLRHLGVSPLPQSSVTEWATRT